MDVSSLGYRTDLMVLSLGGSEVSDRGDHLVVRTSANPHYWWGNFILFERPGDVAERLALFAAEFPEAEHVAWGIDSVDGSAGDDKALTAAGFTIGRDTVMTCAAPALVEPGRPNTDAVFRPLATDDDWSQLLSLRLRSHGQEAAESEAFTTAKIAAERALTESGKAMWFGAFVGDAGLRSSLGLIIDGSELARFQTVETDPDSRGRGLASTLVHYASTYGFDKLAAETLVMIADPDYPAIRIYRSLGFADTETQVQLTRAPS